MTGETASAGPSGLLPIDKPAGMTSHDVVNRVRRALGTKKVGHAGTLDPMATGLLLVGVGRATRLLRFLGEFPKTYEGAGVLGVETDTLDAEGTVVRETPVPPGVDAGALREAMAALTGDVTQVPPAYSAVKVGGRKLYDAARRGEVLEARPRTVHVARFELLAFASPSFDFLVECSAGTYVRSLAAEVGARLECGAHLIRLRRSAIGPFSVQEARPADDPGPPLPPEAAVRHLPSVDVTDEEATAASHGRILGPAGVDGPYRVHGPDGALIGIYRDQGAKALPEVILAPA